MPSRIHRALGCYAISAALASLAWCGDPGDTGRNAGWDGWRGDLHASWEGYQGGEKNAGTPPVSAVAGWAVAQWRLYRLEARVGLLGQAVSPRGLSEDRYGRITNQYGLMILEITDLSLRYPFGASGGGDIQLGLFRAHPGKGPDLFGNYVLRSEPYPGRMPFQIQAADTLGSAADPGEGMRVAFGTEGGPLRAEAFLLEDDGGFSCLGFLEGSLPLGLRWGVAAGVRHAFDWNGYEALYAEPVWAKGNTGVLPIDSARNADASGAIFSDSGGITQRALVLSARLEWSHDFGPAGPSGAFGEAALLGWANQPLLYEDGWRRWAVTAGIRPPTWGLFQVCLLQLEWRPGAYHPIGFADGSAAGGYYLEPADAASPWSYAALLGRDLGRHWALRGRFEYSAQMWSDMRGEGYERVSERIAPDIHRGKGQFSLQVRIEYRFGALL